MQQQHPPGPSPAVVARAIGVAVYFAVAAGRSRISSFGQERTLMELLDYVAGLTPHLKTRQVRRTRRYAARQYKFAA